MTPTAYVATFTPPGENTWTMTYETGAGGFTGRLRSVSHAAVAPATGTAQTTIVYNVPTTGAGAPFDLGASVLANWSQADTGQRQRPADRDSGVSRHSGATARHAVELHEGDDQLHRRYGRVVNIATRAARSASRSTTHSTT